VVAHSHYFDKEQEKDPLQSEKPAPDLFKIKRWIRIRLEVMRIHNPYRGAYKKNEEWQIQIRDEHPGSATLPKGWVLQLLRYRTVPLT
jgi:hypothetical protein